MKIELRERTEETVRIYFATVRSQGLSRTLPQKAKTVEEAVADYRQTLLPGAKSFGRTIWVDGVYAGDVWCYGMDPAGEPEAMVSYCVFREHQGRGVGKRGLGLFLEETARRYGLKTFGAFVYLDNLPSVRVLEGNGFRLVEKMEEEGRLSGYFQLETE